MATAPAAETLGKDPESKAAIHRRMPLALPCLLLFLGVLFLTALPYHPRTGWNVNTRLALVYAVVEQGTFAINDLHDTPPFETMDKAFHDGNYYSDKIWGASLLALPAFKLAAMLNGGVLSFEAGHYVAKIASSAVPAALSAVLLFLIMARTGTPPRRAFVLVALGFFGSGWFGYSTLFMPYAAAIASALGAFYLTLFPPAGRFTAVNCLAIGLLMGYALLCELTMAFLMPGLGLVWLARLADQCGVVGFRAFAETAGDRTRILHGIGLAAVYTVGVIMPLALFAAYCKSIFGEFGIPYQYEVNQEFREGMSRGIMGITSPRLIVLYHLTIHPFRGLFYWTPLLLAGLVGAVLAMRQYGRRRLFGWLAIYTTIAYLTFNAGYYMWWGGWGMGPRFLLPVIPFLLLPAGELLREGRLSAFATRADWALPARAIVLALGLLSLGLSLPLSLTDPQTPQGNTTEQIQSASFSSELIVPQFVHLRLFYRGHITLLPWERMAGVWANDHRVANFLSLLLLLPGIVLLVWAGRLLPAELPGAHRRDYPFATVDGAAAPLPVPRSAVTTESSTS